MLAQEEGGERLSYGIRKNSNLNWPSIALKQSKLFFSVRS